MTLTPTTSPIGASRRTLGVLLIATPLLFNICFGLLGARFDYPGILREPTAVVLDRFQAGGPELVSLWFGFAVTALLFIPVAAIVATQITDPAMRIASLTIGALAGLVQALGLLRWAFVVPFLARARASGDIDAGTIDLVFQVLNRYLGVAVGEHLGYLLTGVWTVLVALGLGLPRWLALPGAVVGGVLAVCSLEYAGPFEQHGWELAGAIVPIAYVLWSVWLIIMGVRSLIVR